MAYNWIDKIVFHCSARFQQMLKVQAEGQQKDIGTGSVIHCINLASVLGFNHGI